MRPDGPQHAGRDGNDSKVKESVQLERDGEEIFSNDDAEGFVLRGGDDTFVLPSAQPFGDRHRGELYLSGRTSAVRMVARLHLSLEQSTTSGRVDPASV